MTALAIILYKEVQNVNYELGFWIPQIKLNSIENHLKIHHFPLYYSLWNPAVCNMHLQAQVCQAFLKPIYTGRPVTEDLLVRILICSTTKQNYVTEAVLV